MKSLSSNPMPSLAPTDMLAEKNVNPSITKNIGRNPLRAEAGTRVNEKSRSSDTVLDFEDLEPASIDDLSPRRMIVFHLDPAVIHVNMTVHHKLGMNPVHDLVERIKSPVRQILKVAITLGG